MLVLSRKEHETIVINGNIHVTIVHCGRGKVKVGIQTPEEVSILRAELKPADELPADFSPCNAVGASDVLAHYAIPSRT